jgi:3-hydroxyisobutyrate dehydrogenase-like beta-hydroxyacid dehydrogenase
MSNSVGFIGLGRMGEAMAKNLLAAGFAVKVWNRDAAKAKPLVAAGAALAKTPREAAAPGGVVVTMVADDRALHEVTSGTDGFGEPLGAGVHLSMSTVSPDASQRLAALHAGFGGSYVAAPVFGRPEAAAAKKLWICASGPAAAKARAKPLMEAMGQGVYDFGEEPHAANVVKLAGNFLIMGAMEALAEAAALGQKYGIDREKLLGMFGATVFGCPIYQNYGRIIAGEQYEPAGFRMALGLKDVNLVLDTAAGVQAPMPLASLLHDRLLSGVARGRADMDWSAIGLAVSEEAGLR